MATHACLSKASAYLLCASEHLKENLWTSLGVQGLGLFTFNAEGRDSIPGQGTKVSHAAQHGQKLIISSSKVWGSAVPPPHSGNR